MAHQKKISVLVIGSGWVTEHRHIPALLDHGSIRIAALVGEDPKRVAFIQKKFSIPKTQVGDITSLDITNFHDCDAVMIGVDPFCHYESAKKALLAGKHVLVEKPFTLSLEEGRELLLLAEEKQVKLAVVHNFQFSTSAQKMFDEAKSGKLGTLRSLEGIQYSNENRRLPKWYPDLPWGLYYDESPHLLYLLQVFGGTLKLQGAEVFFEAQKSTPQIVSASFLTEEGPALLRMNFGASLSEWFLVYHGSKRTGILDIFRDSYFSLPNDGRHAPLDILRTSIRGFWGHFQGSFMSALKVFTGKYLCGNTEVVKIFFDAIVYDRSLGAIDGKNGLLINELQREIMNTARVMRPEKEHE